jgi:hypothetical protein
MMKILTALIATLFVLHTNAQITKGKVLVGGQISAGSSKTNILSQPFQNPLPNPFPTNQTISNKLAIIGISIGKAIKENKVVGINFTTYSFNDRQTNIAFDTTSRKANQYEFGVFYRQYKKIVKDLNFYVQLDAAAFFGKEKITYNSLNPYSLTGKQNGGKLFFSPGVSYAVLKKMQMEISMPNLVGLVFSHASQTSENPIVRTSTNDQFSFNTSLSSNNAIGNLSVGFRLVL